jgi:hypothetical protein
MDMKIHQPGSENIFKLSNETTSEENEKGGENMERRFDPYVMNEGTVSGKPKILIPRSCGRQRLLHCGR